jgi:glutaminyl-peptide cyclotransferase
MAQRVSISHWWDMKFIGWYLFFVLFAGPLALGLLLPWINQIRTTKAASLMAAVPAPIDGERAFGYLKDICAIGPRPAGSEANTRQRNLVAEHFKKLGAAVREQPFTGQDPRSGARVSMVNLIGSWHPERTERVVLGAHYDTRPFPDEETDPAKRNLPFLGANDGASGVALLMEIANHLGELKTPWGVDLVLFDGEELVYGQEGEYFLGSKEFARDYAERAAPSRDKSRYVAGLVLDMVAGRRLTINQEPNSLDLAPRLVREVWSVARQLKATAFRNRVGRAVLDDHLALNNAGIPAIDIIDFEYPQWHRAGDVPASCSAASLEQVGRVVTAWLALPRTRRR